MFAPGTPRFDGPGHRAVTFFLSASEPDRTGPERPGQQAPRTATPGGSPIFSVWLSWWVKAIRLQDPASFSGGWVSAVRVSFENSTVCRAILIRFGVLCQIVCLVAAFDPVGCCGQLFVASQGFVGEFDPGSGRTLAACLTHASRAVRPFRGYTSGERVSNTWVTCPPLWDKPGKLGLIPDRTTDRMVGGGKFFRWGMGPRPISLLVG